MAFLHQIQGNNLFVNFDVGLTFCGDQGLTFNQPSDWYETNIIEKSIEFPLKWLLMGRNQS